MGWIIRVDAQVATAEVQEPSTRAAMRGRPVVAVRATTGAAGGILHVSLITISASVERAGKLALIRIERGPVITRGHNLCQLVRQGSSIISGYPVYQFGSNHQLGATKLVLPYRTIVGTQESDGIAYVGC